MQVIDEEKGRTEAEQVLDNILTSQRAFKTYNDFCDRIDRIYSDRDEMGETLGVIGLTDRRYDLFWSSIEVLKPAIYAKPPAVVVKPRYTDANATDKMTAELLERVINSEFERGHINESMLMVRDDLALLNRGVLWATLDDDDGNAVCNEWLDREDFAHDPARCWNDVGWVARRAWLTLDEMKERFTDVSGDLWQKAFFGEKRDNGGYHFGDDASIPEKAPVWEVWDRTGKRVRWVTPGIDEYLDDAEPHLNLRDFFPCPRPAYGTLIRRTLIPMPDYKRYAVHLDQVNDLTRRIYDLLDRIRVMGFVAGGGDVGSAVQTALAEADSSAIIIPVPGAALTATGGAANMIAWLPLDVIATTITGMIEARAQLFADFDRLSGISDIMRGETEAEETLGAQRMKSQYGSVRVRDKKDELIRLSRDAARISGEIICDNFTQKELLEIAQMDIPTRREVDKSLKDLEKASQAEMDALAEKMKEAAPEQGAQPVDEEQIAAIQQQMQAAHQQIKDKYRPQFQQLSQSVVIEDVMKLIRDDRARSLIIDVETDSTVMTDEIAEKASRAEFLTGFANAIGSIQPLMAAGEQGAKLAGSMLKFALEPFNVSRDLDATIDEFVENAPQIAAAMGGGDEGEGLAEAQGKLAEAEMAKAQAAMTKVQSDSQLKQAENERKMMEFQQKAQSDQMKSMGEAEKLRQQADANSVKAEEALAKVDLLRAQIVKTLAEAGVKVDDQALNEFKSLKDIEFRENEQQMKAAGMVADQQARQVDQAMSAEDRQRQAVESERNAAMGERQQSLSEKQAQGADERASRAEDRADRQQDFSERTSE